MKKKIVLRLGLTMLFMIGAVGCSNAGVSSDKKEDKAIEIKVKHKLGETSVKKTPKNVVVFDYGVLDSLDKMGVEVKALPKSNVPTYLSKFKDDKYTDVGTLQEPNFEKISELKPDLIVIGGRQAKKYEEFKKIAPTVYMDTDDKDYIGSFKTNMKSLANIFDKNDFVDKELKKIDDNIKFLNEKSKKDGKNSLVIMASDGSLSAYGEASRFGMLHKEFGFQAVDKNIESSGHGQKISFEYIVEKNPEYLFVIDRGAIVGGKTSAKQFLENDLIKSTKAYKNKNIVYLTPDVWYLSSGGFDSTNKMIEQAGSVLK
ncbi:siderophore ABC transporter substrate-binding protein [Clostridium tagluense]|uniref:Iron ABC transporter substrate-binding protein n=1 Tax=Clostridium tagluense TaxID=360422 RepID=A0A401UFV3_9CLOT|nr:siderophore ABC transporter substrate-binding protein [Clostridium tagluense]GCD08450.1 iron ABC transporter substrate-binding protein [Clostridium tagluense]